MGQINCLTPLPEDQETPFPMKMLFPAPYDVPEKKAKKIAKGVWSGLHRKGASDVPSKDGTHSSAAEDDDEEEEASDSPPGGKEEKGDLPKFGGEGAQEGEGLPCG